MAALPKRIRDMQHIDHEDYAADYLPPVPWAARNRAGAAQPGDDDRGFRWSDRLHPSPQLLYHMLLAPARLPTASVRSHERQLPRLHNQPRPPPPASSLAPPRRTAQNVENSTLNTRRIAGIGTLERERDAGDAFLESRAQVSVNGRGGVRARDAAPAGGIAGPGSLTDDWSAGGDLRGAERDRRLVCGREEV